MEVSEFEKKYLTGFLDLCDVMEVTSTQTRFDFYMAGVKNHANPKAPQLPDSPFEKRILDKAINFRSNCMSNNFDKHTYTFPCGSVLGLSVHVTLSYMRKEVPPCPENLLG